MVKILCNNVVIRVSQYNQHFWQQIPEVSKKDTNQLSGGYKDFVTSETWILMQSVTHFDKKINN